MKAQLKSIAVALALTLGLAGTVTAQKKVSVSHNPVKDLAAAKAALFTLPEGDSAYYFRADLPGNNFLTIQFGKLSYWQEGSLSDIVATASLAWKHVQDSFTGATTSRKISVHLPPSNYPMIVAISEWGAEQRTLLLKANNAQPLRIAVDTITILKTLPSSGKDTGFKHQILYTFLLKDLNEIEGLAGNVSLVSNISATFDSLVVSKRKRWSHEDAAFHRLDAQYDVYNGSNHSSKLKVNNIGTVMDNFGFNADIGTSFIAGEVAGNGNVRLLFYLKSKGVASKGFLALSCSAITFADEQNNELMLRSLAFLNLEIGSVFSGTTNRIPFYRTSVGLGYRIGEQNKGPYDFKLRGFFNYSVSKAITVTPEFYTIPAKDDKEGKSFIGIAITLRLL